jgi:hypothetical protein
MWIFNHSGANWLYPLVSPGETQAAYTSGQYAFGEWRGDEGQPIPAIVRAEKTGASRVIPRPGSLHPGWHRQSRREAGFPTLMMPSSAVPTSKTCATSRSTPGNAEFPGTGVHVLDRTD